MTRLILAALHLLALGIGLGAVWTRAGALRGVLDPAGVRRVLTADAWWGVAALLWLGTGVWRLLAGTEKATAYYMANHWFLAKMGLFVLVVALEIRPAVTFMGWRKSVRGGATPDTDSAGALAAISTLQAAIVAAIVFLAVAMARGYGVMAE